MANKKPYRRRRKFNLRLVRVQNEQAIGALAADDVISGALTANVVSGAMRFMLLKASWTISDIGAGVDDTFQFGVAHGDYTAAEIEECLEIQAGLDLGDKVAQEQADRLVRSIGVMTKGGVLGNQGVGFNDGKPVTTKLNWAIAIGENLSVWVRNGSGTVYTTGALITTIGELWVKDTL